jgi:hypothetical protein
MDEECTELVCAPADLFSYAIRALIPLAIDWDGSDEILLLLSDGEHILI